MRPITWHHISDIHLRVRDAWSQDVVLTAMCDRIRQQRGSDTAADFILVTGDLAFSGKRDEYELVAKFFDVIADIHVFFEPIEGEAHSSALLFRAALSGLSVCWLL